MKQFSSVVKSSVIRSVPKGMEIEVKIRLPSRESHDKVASILSATVGGPKKVYEQENAFFDGSNKELSSVRTVLRLRRWKDTEPHCVVTLKEDAKIEGGISRAAETEAEIDPQEGDKIIDNPALILPSSHDLLKHVVAKYKCTGFTGLGSFANTRSVFDWEGHKLELDETRYEFGTTWEIEVESTTPEEIKQKLESFLSSNSIPFSYSKKSKFANFLSKKVD